MPRPRQRIGIRSATERRRQRQIAVGDGFSAGRFARRALDIDVDPLMVARRVREAVDPLLVDEKPVSDAEFPSGIGGEIRRSVDFDHPIPSLSMMRSSGSLFQ